MVVADTEANTLSARSIVSSGLVPSGCSSGTYWTVYRSEVVLLVLTRAKEKASGPFAAGAMVGSSVPMTPITTLEWVASWNSQT